ncbi:MAG: hypothetical protein HKN89_04140 [Eudoraea sp.]|nr:hypothetical protein [Eudoraea sp.]
MNLAETRALLQKILGVKSFPELTSFVIRERTEKDGFDQLRIEYTGSENDTIPAYLLVPEGNGPFPAILVHHQHNSQWHYGKSEVAGLVGDLLNAFGPALARNGCIVLCPDSIGFEDRRRNQKGIEKNDQTDWLQYYNGMAYRLVKGELLLTTVLNDAIIGINMIANFPKTDVGNIGILGHSYGGNTSIFHAAVDERVQYVCASGAACSYRNKLENETGLEMSLVVPGILNKLDIPDVICCISPRNILLVAGSEDIYSKDAREISKIVHGNLEKLEVTDRLELKMFEGGHALTKERFDYIIEWTIRQSKETCNNS